MSRYGLPSETGQPVDLVPYGVPDDVELETWSRAAVKPVAMTGGGLAALGALVFIIAAVSQSPRLEFPATLIIVFGGLIALASIILFFPGWFHYFQKPEPGYAAVWRGQVYRERFFMRDLAARSESAMYYVEPIELSSYGFRPNVQTRDGVLLNVRMTFRVQITNPVVYHDRFHATSGENAYDALWRMTSGFQGPINARLQREDYSVELRSRRFLDALLDHNVLAGVRRGLDSLGVRLLDARIDDLKPHWETDMERKSTDKDFTPGIVPESAPPDAQAFAAMQQFGVSVPSTFDYDLIKRDGERMARVGLVGKYFHALKRRFETPAELDLLRTLEKYYLQGRQTTEAALELQKVELRHASFLAKHKATLKKHYADGLEHDARAARAMADAAKAGADILGAFAEGKNHWETLNPKPQPKAKPKPAEPSVQEQIQRRTKQYEREKQEAAELFEGDALRRELRNIEDAYRHDINGIRDRERRRS